MDFNTETTTIVGRNGCGKTSILEAIYEALSGKSFRAVDVEILRRETDYYRVEVEYLDGRKAVVFYNGEKKEFLVGDKKTRRLPKDMKYPIVLFEPDDLHLVGSSPTSKRNYFDRMFGQLSEKYSVDLARYNKALKQRNELLKRDFVKPEDLFSWNVLLVQYGVDLRKTRLKLIEEINKDFTRTYLSIANNGDEVELKYRSGIGEESEFLALLERSFARDVVLGHTSVGVHHDNYEFIFNGSKADGSASRGEVRSSVLALKFIEAAMIEKRMGKKPLVLLDDVFSELDQERQQSLMVNFKDNQVILTTVGDGELTKVVN